ncbi:histidine kinase [Streptomyces albus subsp. albus]|nr:histidine kinase [Streptomyces albus subsp. albus]
MTNGPWHRRHPVAVDTATAVCFALLDTGTTLLGASWWPAHPGALAWAMLGVQAAACLSLAARRRAPLLVVAALGAFTLAVTLLISPLDALTPAHSGNVWAPNATVVAAYGPFFYGRPFHGRDRDDNRGARPLDHRDGDRPSRPPARDDAPHPGDPRWARPDRRTAIWVLAALTAVVARVWQPAVPIIAIGVLRTATGPLLALYFDARRRLVVALTERAERAERERHLLAEQARAEERARLAGEMHDVVTHRVSLMVLQAGALRVTAPDEATRQAAEQLRAAGCQALEELRDLVGILRTAPEGDETPSVAGLAALVAESTAVGTPAELVEEGDRAHASPVVGRTAYRIVREALTNVRKHAPGAQVVVRVRYEEAQVRLTVRNAPPAGAPGTELAGTGSELAGTGSGLGLAGLRQRVELVHGTLRAGRAPDGGFSVEATLPGYVPTAESVG